MTIMKPTLSISTGLFLLAALTHPTFAQTVFPTGTTIYDPTEAYSSYILISDHTAVGNHPSARVRAEGAGASPGDIRLIDMNGNVVHTWEVAPYFNKRSRLLPSGNLVYVRCGSAEVSASLAHPHHWWHITFSRTEVSYRVAPRDRASWRPGNRDVEAR